MKVESKAGHSADLMAEHLADPTVASMADSTEPPLADQWAGMTVAWTVAPMVELLVEKLADCLVVMKVDKTAAL